MDNEQTNDWEPKVAIDMDGVLPGISLPPGWIALYHRSGGVVYLHKTSRVVTWSRPYMLAKRASIKKHDVPLVAIPCLHQLQAKSQSNSVKRKINCPNIQSNISTKRLKIEKDCLETDTNISSTLESENKSEDDKEIPNAFTEVEFITCKAIHSYLSKIFTFKVINDEQSMTPLFCKNTSDQSSQIIVEKKTQPVKFSIENKSPKQVLYEYAQKFLKVDVDFKKKESNFWQNNRADIFAEVSLGNNKYGIGSGGTWKIATHEASTSTLNIIDPTLVGNDHPEKEGDISQYFDSTEICDPELTKKINTYQTSSLKIFCPYETLVILLERHESPEEFKESKLKWSISPTDDDAEKKFEYSLKYEDVVVKGLHDEEDCENIAAQQMIKALYPALTFWGSVIRLSQVKWKMFIQFEKKQVSSEESISTGNSKRLNVLSKLQTEMLKQSSAEI